MPKSRDLSLVRRDEEIQDRIARGDKLRDISRDTGLSPARISQINNSSREFPDEEKRATLVAKLEYILNAKLLDLMNQPLPLKVSASGRPVYELNSDGSLDFSRPVLDTSVIIETSKAAMAAMKELRELQGLTVRRPKEKDESAETAAIFEEYKNLHGVNRDLAAKLAEMEARLARYQDQLPELEVVDDGRGPA
jgi:transcriptional regulator with XRE-family HTH domain